MMCEKKVVSYVKYTTYPTLFKPNTLVYYCDDMLNTIKTNAFIKKFNACSLNKTKVTTKLIIIQNHNKDVLQLFYIARNMNFSTECYDPMFQSVYEFVLDTGSNTALPRDYKNIKAFQDLEDLMRKLYADSVHNIYDIKFQAEHEHNGLHWYNKDAHMIACVISTTVIDESFLNDFSSCNTSIDDLNKCLDISLKHLHYAITNHRFIYDNEHSIYFRLCKISNKYPLITGTYRGNEFDYIEEIHKKDEIICKQNAKIKEQDAKIKEQAEEIVKLKAENKALREKCDTLQEKCDTLQKQVDNLSDKITELFRRFDNYR